MVITLRPGTTKKGVEDIGGKIKELGFAYDISKKAKRTIITVIGENATQFQQIFEEMFIVESITPTIKP